MKNKIPKSPVNEFMILKWNIFQTYGLIWMLILIEYKNEDKKDILFELVNLKAIWKTNNELKKKY